MNKKMTISATVLTSAGLMFLTACNHSAAEQQTDPHVTLSRVKVAPLTDPPGYSRAKFGRAWTDVDHNHCDTRDDILSRDLTDVQRRGACTITAGILHDRYTGKTIYFHRGRFSALVQIDHVYPLHRMWRAGAANWSAAKRERAANDPRNLIAVDGSANESKGDKGPAEWAPRSDEWCDYATRYVRVATTYGLSVTKADKAAIWRMLKTCGSNR